MVEDIKHIVCPNKLNTLFFSDENIKIIQNGLRKKVYDDSNGQHLIGNQSKRELTIIMRSIYLQYSKNLNKNITNQIDSLNKMVIKYSAPKILSNIKQYLHYKKDINNLPIPLEHPENMSNRGSKSLSTFNF